MTISRLDRLEERVNTMEKDVHTIKNSLQVTSASVTSMNKSMKNMQENMDLFSDMAHTVDKIWKWVKRGLPIVVTAAISSGLVSGKWGDFFHALFN